MDGIKYQRLGDESYYAQELFEKEELTGYLKNMLNTTKSVYEQVVYESSVEASLPTSLRRILRSKCMPSFRLVPGLYATRQL